MEKKGKYKEIVSEKLGAWKGKRRERKGYRQTDRVRYKDGKKKRDREQLLLLLFLFPKSDKNIIQSKKNTK